MLCLAKSRHSLVTYADTCDPGPKGSGGDALHHLRAIMGQAEGYIGNEEKTRIWHGFRTGFDFLGHILRGMCSPNDCQARLCD